ncbi:hypothetical protein M5E87_11385 [Flavonifractor plautii]|nr:hypothetical protein M5E87_11385 [Flavonifractor plautii]
MHIPPLRERTEDILPLAEHILLRLNRQQGTGKLFGQAFKKALLAYRWPGNIRELNNIIERAFVLARSDTLELEDLPDEMTAQWLQRTPQGPVPAGSSLHCILEEVEAAVLAQRLQEDRTLSEIAATLGIDLSTLVRKIKSTTCQSGTTVENKTVRESCHKNTGMSPGEMGLRQGQPKPFLLRGGG